MNKVTTLIFSSIFLIACLAKPALCQPTIKNYRSFAIEYKEVIWVQVYHVNDSIENTAYKLFEHLKHKLWISNIHLEGNDILADLAQYRVDYRRYGGKFMNTSVIIRSGKWTGKIRISFKEEKYRVVLSDMIYTAQQTTTNLGKMNMEDHEVTGTLSNWALNNYRTSFRKIRFDNLNILHASFKDSFTLRTDQLIDNDW
jgi:hypothetical protein